MIIENKLTGMSITLTLGWSATEYIPQHMHDGIRLYLEQGVPPGGFLRAVLANDFVGTAGKADSINQQHLLAYAYMLYQLPRICWGSYEQVDEWIRLNEEARRNEHAENEAV